MSQDIVGGLEFSGEIGREGQGEFLVGEEIPEREEEDTISTSSDKAIRRSGTDFGGGTKGCSIEKSGDDAVGLFEEDIVRKAGIEEMSRKK